MPKREHDLESPERPARRYGLIRVWPTTLAMVLALAVPEHATRGQSSDNPQAPPTESTPAKVTEKSTSVNGDRITLTDTGLIDVHFREAEISAILELLSYRLRAGIVATSSVTGRVSVNLYDVDLREALDSILLPRGYAYMKLGNTFLVGTSEEIAAQLPPPETRVFRMQYISASEAAVAVRALLGDKSRVTEGGSKREAGTDNASAFEDASADYLIITASTDRLEDVDRLLHDIDVRPKQVLIEATILRATLSEDNQFGIDFTLLGGVDFENVASTSNAVADLTTGQLPPEMFQKTTFNTGTNLIGNALTSGFNFGLIKDNISVFIRALESVTDVTVIANPKIIALNKQDAEVIIGRRDGYITTTVTQTAAIQTVEFLETGTQIRFRPVINDDGTVRLDVRPKDSNGGLTAANLPFEETTEAHANILVRDGHTILIGGLFRERTTSSREQVPGLGNIPGLGLLFQRRLDQTVREEVIILLTVHIIEDSTAEQLRFAALLNDVERTRVGSRRGLLGIGRERLAQAHYQEALEQAERGRDNLALLNARMALHNNPRHLAAIKLRERLLGERTWDNEGSRTRVFLLDLIRGQRPGQHATPLFGRPELDLDLYSDPTPAPDRGDRP